MVHNLFYFDLFRIVTFLISEQVIAYTVIVTAANTIVKEGSRTT
jgi:hypothetical protein